MTQDALHSTAATDWSHDRPDTHARSAYEILRVTYAALPAVVGVDKFFHRLADWNGYLAPRLAHLSPIPVPTFMRITGVVEILASLAVALRPRIGAYVVAAWLLAIATNLLIAGDFYDIALRDVALALGAIALARLAQTYDRKRAVRTSDAPLRHARV